MRSLKSIFSKIKKFVVNSQEEKSDIPEVRNEDLVVNIPEVDTLKEKKHLPEFIVPRCATVRKTEDGFDYNQQFILKGYADGYGAGYCGRENVSKGKDITYSAYWHGYYQGFCQGAYDSGNSKELKLPALVFTVPQSATFFETSSSVFYDSEYLDKGRIDGFRDAYRELSNASNGKDTFRSAYWNGYACGYESWLSGWI